jgi:rhomboid protease GluP
MIEDRLQSSLINLGYRRIDSSVEGIYLYYITRENELIVVSVIHVINGTELTKEQYEHILKQINENFQKSYPDRVRLLNLIITRNPDGAKHLCMEAQAAIHWLVDINRNRLIIYENQLAYDYLELRDLIEQLLVQEQMTQADIRQPEDHKSYYSTDIEGDSNHGQNYYNATVASSANKIKLLTVVNTIIIGINIFVFLVMHFTNLLGGEERILAGGALSWYNVFAKKEYYRILTSMFMHSDLSHLLNNMLVLLFVGDNLERALGKLRFAIIYFTTGIIAGVASISYNMWKDYAEISLKNVVFSIGASGAIFGVVGAMLYIVIVNRGRLEDISTRQVILFIIFSLYGGISNARIDQAAHIGGFLAGILFAFIIYRRPQRKKTAFTG